jgi:hypothetical protein
MPFTVTSPFRPAIQKYGVISYSHFSFASESAFFSAGETPGIGVAVGVSCPNAHETKVVTPKMS